MNADMTDRMFRLMVRFVELLHDEGYSDEYVTRELVEIGFDERSLIEAGFWYVIKDHRSLFDK